MSPACAARESGKRGRTLAQDSNAKRPRRQSVTRHPLFPFLVAVWWAALFGIASFAVPTWRLENWSLASGIDAVLPAAAPPLGHTARIIFALLCALAGGALGAVLGYRLSGGGRATSPSRRESVTAPEWPVAALEDVGAAPFGRCNEPEPAAQVEIAPEPAVPTAAQRIAAADLDDLSHVELVERLAIGLERRRQRGPASAAQAEAMQRGYSALQALVRKEPPVIENDQRPVVSVGELATRRASSAGAHTASSGQDPEATERALRNALASLQRMSQSN